jgi:hypothetical protein
MLMSVLFGMGTIRFEKDARCASMKYQRVVVTRRGGPEVLRVIEDDLPEQQRVRIMNYKNGHNDSGPIIPYGDRT